jgi:RHS repeat-associated protein
MTYDRLDRLVSTTDPLDNRTSYAYDAAGQLTARTDPRGNITRYAYDGDGRLSSVSAPDGSITTYAYDAAAEMVSRTDPNGHVAHWSYDATGKLAAKTDPLGRQWSYRYDPAGQLVETRAPAGGTIARSYDSVGRVTGVSYSDGTPSVAYAYDPAGNRTQMQDGAGTTAYAYDANGRLVSQSRGSDAFSYSYDAAGRLVSRVYPGGFATSLDYDADGRLTRASSPAGATLYAYDAAGNLLSTTFPNAVVETRTYDAAGRILTIVGKRPASAVGLPDPTAMTSPPPRTLAGTGNGGGNGNAAPQPPLPQGPPAAPESPTPGAPPDPGNGNGNGAPADPATPPTATAEKGNGQGNGNDRGNANGQAKNHEGNADSSGGESGSHGKDDGQAEAGEGGQGKSSGKSGGKAGDKPTTDGELPAKSNGKGNADGRGGKKTCPDKGDGKARGKDSAGAGTRSDGMPAQSCPKPKTLGPIITSFAYTYDSSGNPVQVVTPAGTETYRYDARDRLVEANLPSGRYVYGYDPVGNRLSAQTPAGLTTYVYDAADQLTRAVTAEDEISYTYDGSGNQATAGDRRYTYDLANRLVAAIGDGVPAERSGGEGNVELRYDGDGNLVSESSPHGTTSYLWDSNAGLPQLAVERNDEQARTYGYGIALATLSVDDHSYVYLGDRLGSVAALTDEQTVVNESYRYDPYGALLGPGKSDDRTPGNRPHELNRMLFTGQYLDPSTGLYNLRARNYEAADGHFLQMDPLSPAAHDPYTAGYVYADDRPTVLTDPNGMRAGKLTPVQCRGACASSGEEDPVERELASFQISTRDDCTVVPDSLKIGVRGLVTVNFDFHDSCHNHDTCYGAWITYRKTCDDAFYSEMKRQCITQNGAGNDRAVCYRVAQLYHYGVWQLGGISWVKKAYRYDSSADTGCPYLRADGRLDKRRCFDYVQARSYPPYMPTTRTVVEAVASQALKRLRSFLNDLLPSSPGGGGRCNSLGPCGGLPFP